ncbi:MAG: phasin family protein [Hyphomicrobiaceae bacterium]
MRFGQWFETACDQRPVNGATSEMPLPWQSVSKAAEPVAKAAARTNIECMRFASQRAQALVAVPSRLATCRTPHDLMTEQLRFWQTAVEQYAETTRHVAAIWAGVNPVAQFMASHFETWQQRNEAAKAEAARPANDLITFPEPKAPAKTGVGSDPIRANGYKAA